MRSGKGAPMTVSIGCIRSNKWIDLIFSISSVFNPDFFCVAKKIPYLCLPFKNLVTNANYSAASKKRKRNYKGEEQIKSSGCLPPTSWCLHTCIYNYSKEAKLGPQEGC